MLLSPPDPQRHGAEGEGPVGVAGISSVGIASECQCLVGSEGKGKGIYAVPEECAGVVMPFLSSLAFP